MFLPPPGDIAFRFLAAIDRKHRLYKRNLPKADISNDQLETGQRANGSVTICDINPTMLKAGMYERWSFQEHKRVIQSCAWFPTGLEKEATILAFGGTKVTL
jgi:hypothetical protein